MIIYIPLSFFTLLVYYLSLGQFMTSGSPSRGHNSSQDDLSRNAKLGDRRPGGSSANKTMPRWGTM